MSGYQHLCKSNCLSNRLHLLYLGKTFQVEEEKTYDGLPYSDLLVMLICYLLCTNAPITPVYVYPANEPNLI